MIFKLCYSNGNSCDAVRFCVTGIAAMSLDVTEGDIHLTAHCRHEVLICLCDGVVCLPCTVSPFLQAFQVMVDCKRLQSEPGRFRYGCTGAVDFSGNIPEGRSVV